MVAASPPCAPVDSQLKSNGSDLRPDGESFESSFREERIKEELFADIVDQEQPPPESIAEYLTEKCALCGAFGKDVVCKPDGLCPACFRKINSPQVWDSLKNTNDRDVVQRYLDKGYVDITEEGDFGVLKKMLSPGAPDDSMPPGPNEGCPTTVQFVGRIVDGSIYETTRDVVDGKNVGGTDEPFVFNVEREKAIPGFDVAVKSMHKGETSSFLFLSSTRMVRKDILRKYSPLRLRSKLSF